MDKPKDLEHFIALGKEIDLAGKDLRDFAETKLSEHRAFERDQRALDREAEKGRLTLEKEKEKIALEEKKLQHEKEERESKEKIALETKKLELDQEIKLKTLENQNKPEVKHDQNTQSSNNKNKGPNPKLTIFNEKIDQLDLWFDIFDRQCKLLKVSDEDKISHLMATFHGKYLSAILAIKENSSYEEIRSSMLITFNLTANDFRKRFFSMKPEANETFAGYIQRLSTSLEKWIELSGKNKDYDSLKQLLLSHKIFDSCNENLVSHLMERSITDVHDMETQATAFFQAHANMSLGQKTDMYLGAHAAFPERGRTFQKGQPHGSGPPFRARSSSYYKNGTNYDNPNKKFWVRNRSNSRQYRDEKKSQRDLRCFHCGIAGHKIRNCRKYEAERREYATKDKFGEDHSLPASFALPKVSIDKSTLIGESSTKYPCHQLSLESKPWETKHIYSGLLKQGNDMKPVAVLRDTGSAVHAVHDKFINEDQLTGKYQKLITFGGKCENFPLAEIFVDTPFISGTITVCVLSGYPEKFRYYDLLIGNGGILKSPIAKDPHPDLVSRWVKEHPHTDPIPICQVETRSSSKEKEVSKLNSLEIDLNLSHSDIINLQRNDNTLSKYYTLLGKNPKISKGNNKVSFELLNGVLVRIFQNDKESITQIMLPSSLRTKIMSLSHDTPFSGHMGVQRTKSRISTSFYWPKMNADIRHFCKSCDICAKTRPKGQTRRAPLQTSPLISIPFTKCATDLIGPLPITERKNMYILTLIDYATRWVEATALKVTTTTIVAEELLNMFSRFGIPKILLSDGGPQFTSAIMEEVLSLLGINHSVTTPYHPEANGLCERVNGTIKSMLRKLAFDNPKSWDRLLQCALFAYREVPQETTGFSPFLLVYGREARGPVSLIKDLWLNTTLEVETKSAYTHVIDLQRKISHCCELACERTRDQNDKSKKRYDRKAKLRTFTENDKVLLFLPTSSNKLTSQWKGPYQIVRKINDVDYVINIDGKHKTYHINMLQEFIPRFIEEKQKPQSSETHDAELLSEAKSIVNGESVLPCDNTIGLVSEDASGEPPEPGKIDTIILPSTYQTETIKSVSINENLSQTQAEEIRQILEEFSDVFSDVPSKTHVIEHSIELQDKKPIFRKPYPLSFSSEKIIREEVQSMLAMDIIEKSDSPYSSPIVLVKKKDGKVRFCIDYRQINLQTLPICVPIPDVDLLFAKLSKAKYFTKFDLCKGYWQIPIAEEYRHITAFQAAGNLWQFKTMPFGLKTAPATFNRMMSKLLGHRLDVVFFFDDTTTFHELFSDHVQAIRDTLSIFREANIKVKPSKTEIGFTEIQLLGHKVGNGQLKPSDDNTNKILNIQKPDTKRKIKSLMGLISYYGKFLPHLATLMKPISDLLGKTSSGRVVWARECDEALLSVKSALSTHPALKLPDLTSPFVLQVDASGTGLGGVLLQYEGNILRPCMFISKKLTETERRYSVTEREALAIYWSVQRLARYLLGQHFIIQSDHRPLQTIIQGRPQNARLYRWAMSLSQYDFSIEYIEGSKNILADFLSRQHETTIA